MARNLRVILICDSDDQVKNLSEDLQSTGFSLKVEHVTDAATLRSAIAKTSGQDVVLLCLPNRLIPLEECVRETQRVVLAPPVICIGERIAEQVPEYLLLGAADLVETGATRHLTQVIERELDAQISDCELEKFKTSYSELETRYHKLMNEFEQPLAYIHDGIHVFANLAYYRLFNLSLEDDINTIPMMDLLPESEQLAVKSLLKSQKNELDTQSLEIHLDEHDARQLKCSQVIFDGMSCIQVIFSQHEQIEEDEISKHLDHLVLFDVTSGLYSRTHFIHQIEKAAPNTDAEDSVTAIHQAVVLIAIENYTELAAQIGLSEVDSLYADVGRGIKSHISVDDLLCRYDQSTFGLLINSTDIDSLNAFISRLVDTLNEQEFYAENQKAKCKLIAGSATLNDSSAFEMLTLAANNLQPEPTKSSELGIENKIKNRTENKTEQKQRQATSTRTEALKHLDKLNRQEQAIPPPHALVKETKQRQISETRSSIDANWTAQLKSALSENRLRLNFRPIIPVDGDNRDRFSVSMSIATSHNGDIHEREFLRSAKRSGFILKLDQWIIENFQRQFQAQFPDTPKPELFIQLSSETLFTQSKTNWLGQNISALNASDSNIIIQFGMKSLLDNLQPAKLLIATLEPLGFKFAINQSSEFSDPFPAIQFVKPSYLILEEHLTQQADSNKKAGKSIGSITTRAHQENMKVIAMNVQNADQFFALKDLGIDYGQGDFFQPASTYKYKSSVMPG